jgi:ligand-binding sensor domain-containing protein
LLIINSLSIKILFAYSILWAILSLNLLAQQPPMWHLTDEQGLPSMTVYDVFQDSKGFIWFGTELGICRYDGTRFQAFTLPLSKGEAVSDIKEDVEGNIWFINFVGQLFYIQKDRVFEQKLPPNFQTNGVVKYAIDSQNNLWIGGKAIYKWLAKNKSWQRISDQLVKEPFFISSISRDAQDNIWLSNNNEPKYIYQINKDKLHKIHLQLQQPNNVPDLRIVTATQQTMVLNRNDNSLYLLRKGVFQSIDNQSVKSSKNQFLHGRADPADNFWVLTNQGLLGFDKNLQALYQGQAILPNSAVSGILLDRENNYWITTLNDGVFVMPNKNILLFNRFHSNLQNAPVLALAPAENNDIWLALENGKIKRLNADNQVIREIDLEDATNIESLYYDFKNQILYVAGRCIYGFKNNENRPFFKIMCDAPKDLQFFQNHLLAATSWTAYLVNLANKIGTQAPLDSLWRKSFPFDYQRISRRDVSFLYLREQRARCVWACERGFWVGFADGLFYYENGQSYELKDAQNQPIIARSFTQTADGLLWVGTLNRGVYQIQNREVKAHFTTTQGLVSNYCRSLASDGQKLWIGTDKGLQVFDYQQNTIDLINRQDGLLANEILDILIQTKYVWVATGNGLFRVPKNELSRNQNPPPIYITQVTVWENQLPMQADYQLAYTQNNLKIEFQGLAFRSRGKFKYKYRMLGLDSSWIFTESSNNFARYPSLPSGKYEFQVKAINEDGIESEGTAVLQIRVLPPFWQTWWFLGLCLIGIIGLLSIIFWLRLRLIERRNRIEQALRQSQLAALQVQMNPHFIFNALNSIQEFILLNEKRLANEYLGKFADLMRLTLDMSTQAEVSLPDEIKHLELYLALEKLRFEDLIYEIEIDKDLAAHEISIPAMLIQPYLENALKHGLLHQKNNRRLWLRFYKKINEKTSNSLTMKVLVCEIEDNGIGRKKSEELKQNRPQKHKSFATSATQKRLDILNHNRKQAILLQIEDLVDEANGESGTRVRLEIPIF